MKPTFYILTALIFLLTIKIFDAYSEDKIYVNIPYGDKYSFEPIEEKIRRQACPIRPEFEPREIVISLMDIKKGSTILDLGAGFGYYTFKFAEVLKGTGKVFGTEIEQKMVAFLENEKKEKKYGNVFPVLVSPIGVDSFYKENKFDIIFVGGTYPYIPQAREYFMELRDSLKEKGKLYVFQYYPTKEFFDETYVNIKKIADILVSQGKDFPVFNLLSDETKNIINDLKKGKKVDNYIMCVRILSDFNKILYDRNFFYSLENYYKKEKSMNNLVWLKERSENQYSLIKNLSETLLKNKILNENTILNREDINNLIKLNSMLLANIYPTSELLPNPNERNQFLVEKRSVIAVLESAGYKFLAEYDNFKYEYFLVFEK